LASRKPPAREKVEETIGPFRRRGDPKIDGEKKILQKKKTILDAKERGRVAKRELIPRKKREGYSTSVVKE